MKGVSGPVHYKRGTGAGTPTADLLFTFLMARLMRVIHSKLVDAKLIPQFDASPDCFFEEARTGHNHIMGASLIDDSFFNSIHANPATCVANGASIAAIVFDEFAFHSIDINFEKGKTEFLIDLIVDGSKPIASSIFSMPVPHILVTSRFYGAVPIHVCIIYEHMGSKQTAGHSRLPEIKYRSDSALGATKEVGHMLRSSKLTCHTKLCMVRSLSLFCATTLHLSTAGRLLSPTAFPKHI